MEQNLTITEVARRSGLRASAIRYYESIQLLPPPQRVSGHRRYDQSVLERLAFIQKAQKLGFSLNEIQHLFMNQADLEASLSARWQSLARQKLIEVNTLLVQATDIKHLLEEGLECECSNLADCIDCVLGTTSK